MSYFGWRDVWALLRAARGGETARFEQEFAAYLGVRHAVATSYGRTALYTGLKATGVAGREVLLPAFVCTVVRHAVLAAGARPRFVDVEPQSFEMDLEDLRRKISPATRAVILIHYFGRVARNLDAVADIARRRGLLFVEDCAHVLGASRGGRKVGRHGDFAIFSLTKNTLNFGGGVLVTDDDGLHRAARTVLAEAPLARATRIADFPSVLAYGFAQFSAKLGEDRPRRRRVRLGWIPGAVLALRRGLLRGVRGGGGDPPAAASGTGPSPVAPWSYPLPMEPLIASLGRSQLRKIDVLNARRARALRVLGADARWPGSAGEGAGDDAPGFLVVRVKAGRSRDAARAAATLGLALRPTWPTRQRLWDGQDTPAVRRIGAEVLVGSLHPDLTGEELERLRRGVAALGATYGISEVGGLG